MFFKDVVLRRVGFTGSVVEDGNKDGILASSKEISLRPSRLHRRDTPHHLKNKRITTSVDKEKVASIIAQVIHFLSILSVVIKLMCY